MKIRPQFIFLIQDLIKAKKQLKKSKADLSYMLLITIMLSGFFGYSQFSCPSTFYQVISGELRSYDPITAEYSAPIHTSDIYNAAGYNRIDNYVYAIGKAGAINGHLIRIDVDGTISDLGALTNMGSGGISGDVDDSDNLWINRGKHYDKIENLSTLPVGGSPAVVTVTFTGGSSKNTNDVAFINGKLYGVSNTANLIIWDLVAFTKTDVPGLTTPTATNYGAAFTDDQDRLYVSYNNGGLYLINDYTTGTPTASFLNTTAGTTSNDGFSCPLAPSAIDQDGDNNLDPLDLDLDGDGLTNIDESPSDPFADADADLVFAYLDDNDTAPGTGNVDGAVESGFDTDGDGVPDFFDLDSDNDGIYDVVEAGHGLPHTNGRITGQNTGSGANGLFDGVETVAESGVLNYTITNTDASGAPNFQSTDSDGDTCSDVLEAGFTDDSSDGILGSFVVTVDKDGVVTSAVDGYTTPNPDYLNNVVVSTACTLTPFSCPQNFFQVINGELRSYNPITGEYSDPIAVSQLYNATGYNRVDNYVYAIGKGGGSSPINNHLLRIGEDGAFQDLGALINMGTGGISGDVDASDNLWINRGGHYDKIENLSTLPVGGSPAVVTVTFTGGTSKNTNDVVFINGKLYGVTDTDLLISWDVTTLVKTETSGLGTPTATNFGAAFTDGEDRLYVSYNDGGMYMINNYDTPTPTASFLNSTVATTSNDGFSCPTAISAFNDDNDLVLDPLDIDVDNDGIPNIDESPSDPYADTDNDNVFAYLDDDDTNNLVGNADDAIQAIFDTDGDGIPDFFDLDSDNDGIYDADEAGHGLPNTAGRITGAVTGSGANGLYDGIETGVESGILNYTITATAGTPNFQSLDSDGDGCSDANEAYNDWNADGADGGVYNPGNVATEPLRVIDSTVNLRGLVVAASYSTGVVAAVTDNGIATGCEDGDGVTAVIEDEGPNGGDGNGDGIPDSIQGNVASIPIADGTGYVTVETTGVCIQISSVSTVLETELATGDTTYNYPYGLVDFTLDCITPGDDVTVTYYWHITNSLAGFEYRKYGPTTPGGATDVFQNFTTGLGTTTIGSRTVATASYVLTDGVFGDDTVSDGQIIDPAGPAILTVNSDADGIIDTLDLDDDNDGILDRDECDLGGGTFGVELVDDANSIFEITAESNANTLANLLFVPNTDLTLISSTVNMGNGSVTQIGTFNDGDQITSSGGALNAFVGFDRGIIFSSGNVLELDDVLSNQFSSPFALGDGSNGTGAGGGGSDPDFGGGSSEFDVASLEIVINVPAETIITGQFVFASEEYNDYVNTGLNDAPKIFVNGTNLALTPSGAQLSIDTVNNTVDSGSFIDNETVSTAINIEADGFTETITFSAVLNAGNNTIKIGVADNGDNLYDSWLVFKANSFVLCFDRDTDGDTIVDRLDLDSDNDGIYDAVEAGHNQTHVNGVVPGAVSGDGVPDTVQGAGNESSGTVNYTVADSDTDTNFNFLELDSDNDGCNDVVEAGFTDGDTNGYLGSGTFGAGLTVDGNGVVTSGSDGYTGTNVNVTTAGIAPSITTQPINATICSGGDTTFTVATSDGDAYQWQLFNGTIWEDLIDTGIHSTTNTATLTITNGLIADNGNEYRVIVSSSTYVCTTVTSNTAILTVNDLPTAAAITGATAVCMGATIDLTEGTAGTIAWSSSNLAVATIDGSGVVTPVSAGTTDITYTVTDGNGCTSTASAVHTVTVNDLPTAAAITGATAVCMGSTIDLTEGTAGTIAWSSSNVAVATIDGSGVVTPVSAGTTDITYTVTDGNGCTSTASAVHTVTVNDLPTAAAITGATAVCMGSTIDLTEGTAGTIAWSSSNVAVATIDGAGVVTPVSSGTTDITYTVTDGNGCTSTASAVHTVTVNDLPTATAITGATAVCMGSTIDLTEGTAGTIVWSSSNLAVATIDGAGVVTPVSTGTTDITYTVTDGNGCTSASSAVHTVTVNSLPTAAPITGATAVCMGATIDLTEGTAGTIVWSSSNLAVATIDGSGVVTPVSSGTTDITYTVTDGNGCTSASSAVHTVTVNDLPIAAAITGATAVCMGSTIDLTEGTAGTIVWSSSNVAVATIDGSGVVTPVSAGTTDITYTVTDGNGCTSTASAVHTVTVNSLPTAAAIIGATAVCIGATIDLTEGTAGTIVWSSSNLAVATIDGSGVVTPVSSGTTDITYTVTDGNGCTSASSAVHTVTVNDLPTAAAITGATAVCMGATIDLTVGTAGTIAWSSSNLAVATIDGAGVVTPVSAGTTDITYTVTDGNGCTSTASAVHTVTVNDLPIAAAITGATAVCIGSTIDLTEGTAGTIVWSSSNLAVATIDGSGVVTPVSAGTTDITYTVTDGNGCTSASSAVHTVTVNDLPTAAAITGATAVCMGATIDLTEGTAGTIVWSSSNLAVATIDGAGVVTPVSSGTTDITYTVTDGNGCTSTASAVHTVTVNDLPTAAAITGATAVCMGATIDLTEGTAGTIVWSSSNVAVATIDGSGVVTPVSAGTTDITYTVTDGNGCTSASSAVHTVTVNDLPTAAAITGATAVCMGATIDLTEGTAGTIVWSSSNVAVATIDGSGVVTPVSAGTTDITYTVTDGNGCTSTSSAVHTVTVNDLPTAAAITGATAVCMGATIDLTEGTAGTIVWSSSNVAVATIDGSGVVTPVSAGTTDITYTVTDGNGCTSASSAVHTVTVNSLPTAAAITGATAVCMGATIDLTEGTAGTIVWSSSNVAVATIDGSGVVTPISAGTTDITYTVTDGNGCTSVSSAVHTVTVNDLPTAAAITGATEVCMGATIDLTEGTAGTIVWSSSNLAVATIDGAGVVTPVSAGTTDITYTVTDGNGCTSTASAVHTVTVNDLPTAAAITGATAVCMGATIDLTEGTAGTIVWSSSNLAVATIDGAGVVTPVSSGTTDITYTVTDGNGCTSTASAVHTVTVNDLPIAAAITGATAVCMGATIDLTEGTAGTIVWSSSNLAVATIDGAGVVTPVSAGTTDITYTVTDGNGCTSTASAVHTVTVNDLPTAAAITGATAVCMGATIDLTEGTAGTIVWSSSNLAVATIDGAGVVTSVSAGTTDITYTVTDGNGCTSASSAVHTVTVNDLPIAAAITGATAVCMGATIDLTEGTAGTIVWSSSNVAVATIDGSGVVTPVSAGTTDITYTVTDGNGCTSTASAVHTVTVNSLPTAAAIIGATAVCIGATIDLTEGTAGTIVWSSSNLAVATIDGSGVVTPVSSGTTDITYTVTDGNGCTSASSAVHTVTVNDLPTAAAITGATAVCMGATIDLTVGTAGTIAWSSSNLAVATIDGAGVVTPVSAGTTDITYTVTDGNGCTSTASAVHTVTVNDLPIAAAITGATAVCIGSTIDLTEGTAGTIVWSSSNLAVATIDGSGVVTPVSAGTTDITYTVTDGNGCTSASSAVHTVTVNDLPTAAAITGATAVCMGATIDLTEGTAGTIVWSSSNLAVATIDGAGVVTPVSSGTTDITYTVTDGNGCTSTASAVHTVTVNDLPTAAAITGATAVCMGATIDLTEGTAGTIVWSSSNLAVATIDGSGVVTPVSVGTTDITYTVTDGNGCTSTASAVHTVTVNDLPTAAAITGATAVCMGSTIDLTEGTAGTIAWSSSNLAVATIDGSGVVTPVSAGTTDITYTVTDGNGCTSVSSAVHTVTVNDLPIAAAITGATAVCMGATIDLTEGTAGTIVWSSSNLAVATIDGAGVVTPVSAGTTDITYTVTDGNGCTSTASAVHTVTVNDLPTAAAITGATAVCMGSTIDLTEGTAGTIVWSSSNLAVATIDGSGVVTPVSSGTTDITYTVTDGNGCTSASSAVHTVTVNDLPTAAAITGATAVCMGATIDLTEGTAGTIVWSSSNLAVATIDGAGVVTPVSAGTTDITYTVTDGNSCTSVSSAVHTVTVNDLPTAAAITGATAVCMGATIDLTEGTAGTIAWSSSNLAVATIDGAGVVTPVSAGTTDITYTVTDGNGCTSTASAVHTVTVNDLPIAAAITGATAVCIGSTIDLTEGTAGTIVWSSSNLAVATIDGSGVVTPVSAGTTDITYTVTDGNGCTSASSAVHTVTVNDLPTAAAITGATAVCMGATIDLTEGTAGTIVWSSSNVAVATIDGSGVVTPVSAGTTDITYTVTDGNGCTSTSSAVHTVTVNDLPTAAAITGATAVCMGATIDLTEGTAGTIVWSSSNVAVATIDGSGVVTPVSAGTTDITYTVTDGNGCTSASSAVHTVTVNSLPTAAAITGATAVCMGATIDLTEGTAGTIVWSSSNVAVATIDGSGVVTPISAGTTDITYTVTDGNGCTSVSSAVHTVTVNDLPTAAAITGATEVCMGATIDLTEGTAGTIVWSSSNLAVATIDGAGVVTPVSAGTTDITYTVTDGNGCTSTASAVHTVTVNDLPTAAAITGATAVCMGATIDLTEGTAGTIVWSSSNLAVATIDGAGVVTPVSSGTTDITYTVTDGNGCTSTASAVHTVTVNDLPIAAAITGATAVCMGATIDLTEGTAGTIVWSSSNLAVATIDGAGVVTPVSAGTTDITYTVTDGNGCTSTASAVHTVTVNDLPTAAAITGATAVCMGATIDLTEGTAGTIVWSSSNLAVATIDGAGVVTSVSAGTTDITYTVTDGNGCTSASSAVHTVTVNDLPIAAAITGATAVCMGATIDLTEGTAGTIVWSSSNVAVATIDGSGVVTPVSAGTTDITYTVTDGNGCTSTASAVHTVTVNSLPTAAAIIGATAVCIGATIDLTEGTAGTIVWSSSNLAVATIDGSGVVTPVSSGTTDITYTVTDGNGCTSASSAVHTVTVNDLPTAAAITGATAVCMGATIDLTVGTAGTIAWSSSNLAVATIDGAGVVTPVSAGTTDITYTVTDGNGCTSTASAVHTVTVNDLPIAAAITGATAVCIGSTIDLTEGTAGTIVWSSSNLAVATIDGSGVVTPVSAGTTDITYTVTDGNGCTSASSAVHTVTVNDLPTAAAITGATAVCMGATIDLTEGTAGTIVWSSSNLAVATIDGAGVVTPVSSGTTDITYTVTDGNGCTSTASAVHTVTVNDLPTAAAITGATAVCMGATIDLTEGTAGTIVWSSSNLAVATIDGSGVVTPVSVGTTDITYTVTDGNGCTSTASAVHTVTVNDLPTAAAITGATAVCMGSTIDLTEGTAGTIAWSSSNLAVATIDGSGVVTPVSAGTTDITYTVTDGNGCTSVSSAVHTVTVNDLPIAAAITGATAVCMGATIDLTEGTAGTIVWSSSNLAVATIDGSGVVTPVSAGTTDITYTVTDGNGCTSASSAVHTVTVNSLPTAAAITGATAVCMGATIDLTEGTAGTIAWSSSNVAVATIDGAGVVTPVSAGTTDISYTVTDGNGCTSASSAVHTVTVNDLPTAATITGATAVCMGSTIDLTEGTAGTIAWSSSNLAVATIDGSGVVTPVSAGTTDITYTVTDGNGCTSVSSAVHTVTVNDLPTAAAITGATAVCMGATIDLTEGTAGTIAWSSSNLAVATIDGAGVVTPVSAGTTDITYTVTDGNGCTSTASAVHTVTVNDLPTAAAITGATAVCMGSTIDLTEGTAGTIVWSSSNLAVATIDGSGVVTPVSSGTTDITYTVTDGNGCTSASSAVHTVTVNDLPTAAAITGATAVCMGATIDLTEGTAGTIVWSSSNLAVATIDGAGVVTPVSAGTTDITYTVTDGNSCTSTASAVHTVTVNSLPTAAAITGATAVCMGATIDLTEGTAGTIAWSSSNLAVATIDGSGVVTPVSAGTTDITYTVTDGNGCTSTASAVHTVTVNDLPTAAGITGATAVCMGATIDLTEGTAGTIAWSSSNLAVATIDGSGVVTPVSAGTTDITYTVTDGNGCTSASSAVHTVTVNTLPTAAAITGATAVCMGATIDLTEGTAGTIVWSSSNLAVATIDGSGVVTPVSAGTTDITYTVTDGNGCTSASSAVHTVTVNDLPTAAAITGATAVCMGATIDLTEGTAGTIVWSSSNLAVATIDGAGVVTPVSSGTTDITYTVTDGNGCTSTASAVHTVTVNDLPTAAAITGATAVCMGATIDLTEGTAGTIAWSSSNLAVATIDGSGVVTPVSAGTTDISYTVTDGNGCTSASSAVHTVTVNDLPTAAAITGATAVCMGATIDLTEGTAGAIVWSSSNLAVATIDGAGVVTPVSAGTTDITYTVTDGNGCTSASSAVHTVTVNDLPTATAITGATAVCMGATIDLTEGTAGTIAWSSSNLAVATIDGAGVVTPVSSGTTDITYTVTDGNGCTSASSAVHTVTVNDLPTAAAITGATAVCMGSTIDLTEGTAGTIAWSSSNLAVATIDGAGVVTPVSAGTTDITYTVTDGNGCTSTASAVHTVTVNSLPTAAAITGATAVCMGATIDLTEGTAGTIVWSSSNVAVATIDGSGVVTPVSAGTTDISYTVTDGNGCTSASSAVHTVTVNSLPTAAAITGATAVCMGSTIDLTEGTAGTIVWSSSNLAVATIDGAGVVTPVSAGTTDITYTVTDGNGCTSVSSAVHTVTVNSLPTAAAITGATAVCMGATIDLTEGTAGTIAWSSSNLAVATIDGAGVVTPVSAGTTDITYTVTDGNGCTSTASAVHTVTVNSLPTAAAITGATAVCMGATIDLTEGTAGTIVWSSSNVAVATIDGSGVVTPVSAGTTDISYTVTDGNGCTSVSSAVHTVTVNSLPTAAAITGATAVCMGATIDLTEGTAGTIVWSSSNLAVATIDGAGVVTPVSAGTTDITYTVTDGNGCTSVSSAVHTVTVNSLPTAAAITGATAVCMGSTIDLTEGTAGTIVWSSSNVAVATIDGSGVVTPVSAGTTDITYTVTDGNGCTSVSSAVHTVTVDSTPTTVVITCPPAVNVIIDTGLCTASGVVLGTPIIGTTCAITTVTNDAPAIFPVGDTNVTWTVTDNFGNSNSCIQIVTVIDNIDPTIICPANISVNVNSGTCQATGVSLGTPTIADNCGASFSNDAPAIFPLGDTIVTWTVTDGSGNTNSCMQTVTVIDNIDPTIICPANISVYVDPGSCAGTGVDLGIPVTGDNCTVAGVSNDAPVIFPVGDTTVTWTVTDSSGNTDTCTQIVTVIDNIKPTIIDCPSDIMLTTNTNNCSIPVTWTPPTASDNCKGAPSVSSTHDSGDMFAVGATTIVTYTFTDLSGNSDSCSFNITVSGVVVAINDMVSLDGDTGDSSSNIVNDNDLFSCNLAILNTDVAITNVMDNDPEDDINLDPLTGIITVLPGTPAGEYLIRYTLCSIDTPTICDEASIIITVTSSGGGDVSNLALTKTGAYVDTNDDDIVNVGDEIHYNFTVENTGSVDLINIVLTDPLPGVEVIGGPIDLEAGEVDEDNFTAIYTLTEEDLLSGRVTNQATVTGQNPDGNTVTDISDDPSDDTNVDLDGDGDFEDETIVRIRFDEEIIVYSGMSPNGDGVNDVFVIEGIEEFENTLTIFNRWGVKVYESKNYGRDNNFFRGISNGRSTIEGKEELPVGTYYYVVEYILQSGQRKNKAGYLYLNR
ncbi:Ig-like domain-containing protein [Aquimarina aquimarini]|uniref:Ig-like domain-containing protein n=3 Tax=Aquimarina aquimarini TaxID=1191734 RepID=UPI001F1D653C|nr:Ig-like domain-containing protein [Aquimarina aquimarini]